MEASGRMPASLLQASWPAAEPHFVDTQSSARPVDRACDHRADTSTSCSRARTPSLAAEADEPKQAILHRLPLISPLSGFNPRIRPTWLETTSTVRFKDRRDPSRRAPSERPIHAFLELLAEEFARGADALALLEESPNGRDESPPYFAVTDCRHKRSNSFATRVQKRARLHTARPCRRMGTQCPQRSVQRICSSFLAGGIFQRPSRPHLPCRSGAWCKGGEYLWIVDSQDHSIHEDRSRGVPLQERQRCAAQLETIRSNDARFQ